jgi:hypothetical protein
MENGESKIGAAKPEGFSEANGATLSATLFSQGNLPMKNVQPLNDRYISRSFLIFHF